MLKFEMFLDHRTREVAPQVAMLDDKYICIGTDYGHIHTASGDIRTWGSYSGARRFLNAYLKARNPQETS